MIQQPHAIRFRDAATMAALAIGVLAGCGTPSPSMPADAGEPTGTIVFVRSSGRTAELRALDVETGEDRPITTGNGRVSTPAWSPDGERLAYARRDFRPGSGFAIEILDVESGERRRTTPGRMIEGSPTWSPGGDAIAFSANWDGAAFAIHVVYLDGDDFRRLTNGQQPAWSPDGSTIAFVRLADGVPRVHGVDPSADEPQPYAISGLGSRGERDPSWSRDGRRLAVSSRSAKGDWDLTIIEVDSGRRRTIERPGTDERQPTWSADGAWIAFARVSEELSTIWILNPETGAEREVTSGNDFDLMPSWRPQNVP